MHAHITQCMHACIIRRSVAGGPLTRPTAAVRVLAVTQSESTFTVGLVQMSCAPEPAANLEKAVARVREAARRGAQIICLQELFRSPYFCQREDVALFDLAEPIPGPSTAALSSVARELGVVIVASLFERRAPGVYHNTAVVLDADGSERGRYRKMHIPDDPLYYEKFYFTPGDLGFRAFPTRFGNIGVLVCWDQWFPEGARLATLAGADILLYPTAIGWHPREKAEHGAAQAAAWQTIQRAHAIANGVFVAAVNRVGHEGPAGGGIEFWGGSFVCDPFGVILEEASRTDEQILVVTCDRARQEDVRRNWPFLRDRRIDAYAPLTRRLLDET
jgi:N-carbamoylputrescine amidase